MKISRQAKRGQAQLCGVNCEVIYAAAHAEFPDTEPLGGGKAVADYLIREWRRTQPFQVTVLSPQSLKLPLVKPLADLSELEYARFCRQFERAATAEILRRDPANCVVLANDISEGPDFAALGARGYRVATIWHVDVVEYFTKFYLHNLVRPETVAKFRRFSLLPDVLRLVFQKQHDCVRHSVRHIVPSVPMRDQICRCYPHCPAENIVVMPWGNVAAPHPDPLPDIRRGEGIYNRFPSPLSHKGEGQGEGCAADDEFVIMTLSRLSPEKGIERLLAALPFVEGKFRVWICGAPAYMQGHKYAAKLRRSANERVEFLGHVTGEHKAALLQRADLFVSPSRHESYGLAIAEAAAAGCRIISHQHYGATGTVVDCGEPRRLAAAITELIRCDRTPKTETTAAGSDAANRLAKVLLELASPS